MILCVMEFVIGSSQLVNQIPDDERNFNNYIIMYPLQLAIHPIHRSMGTVMQGLGHTM